MSISTHSMMQSGVQPEASVKNSGRMTYTGLKEAVIAALLLTVSYGVFLLEDATIFRLGKEDGLFEYATAICFGVAGIMFLARFLWDRSGNDLLVLKTRRNVFFVLLGLLFIFGCGEEISWGQRFFGFDTPQTIAHVNLQGETNIHNLSIFHRRDETGHDKSGFMLWLSIERLFSLFWLMYCFVVPLAVAVNKPLRRLVMKINLPIVPLCLGILFPLNYAIAKMIERGLGGEASNLHWPLLEIKEFGFAALFLLTAIYFLLCIYKRNPLHAQTPAAQL